MCIKGETTLPWWSFIVALLLGSFITVSGQHVCFLNGQADALLAAVLNDSLCSNGDRHFHESAFQDGRWCRQPWAASRQFICQHAHFSSRVVADHVLVLQFSMWSHDVVSQSIGLAGDLKMGECSCRYLRSLPLSNPIHLGQYLKVPPRVMFITQIWGALLGAVINYGSWPHA